MTRPPEHYILATGGKDAQRLRLLHDVYGPGTEALLRRAGLRPGLRVAEVGCGSGNPACWVAELGGRHGWVVAVSVSPDLVEQARRQAADRGLRNVEFRVADAYAPGLPEGAFDLAYCRLVLMHLTRPADALAALRALVRPGGMVACEEMDLGCWVCDPPAEAMTRFVALNAALGERRGEDYSLGASRHRLFRAAGLARPEVGANFAVAVRGERKRLLGMTFAEFAPELVKEGLASADEVDRVAAGLTALADDETTLFGFPLVVQVWAAR